jgi:hypothetical protein
LLSVSDVICNKRIVAYVDNQAVVYAIWNRLITNRGIQFRSRYGQTHGNTQACEFLYNSNWYLLTL